MESKQWWDMNQEENKQEGNKEECKRKTFTMNVNLCLCKGCLEEKKKEHQEYKNWAGQIIEGIRFNEQEREEAKKKTRTDIRKYMHVVGL